MQLYFHHKTNYYRHWRITHDPDRPQAVFHCQEPGCDPTFTEKGLTKHLRTIHDLDRPIFPCSELGCNSTFASQCNYVRHWKTAHDPDSPTFPCLCDGCLFASKRQSSTQFHLKSHSIRTIKEYPAKAGELKGQELELYCT
jgi:hypothetical protein